MMTTEDVQNLRDGLELDLGQSFPETFRQVTEVCSEVLELRETVALFQTKTQVANALANGYLDRLCEAKQLLREVARELKHGEGCPRQKFVNHNRHLPPTHPAWASAPECKCSVRVIDTFLKKYEY